MRYYIADSHFYHESILTKMDKRGFSTVQEMNTYMIKQWNDTVRNNDDVIILGDLSWGNVEQTQAIIEQLHGRLYLIKGNHDYYIDDKKFDSSRFGWIREYTELNDNKRKVVLCHYPIACYNGQYRRNGEGVPKTYMLHGHIHKTRDQQLLDDYQEYVTQHEYETMDGHIEHIPCQLINCFCMYSDYRPLTLDQWIEVDKKRRIQINNEIV